MNMDVMWRIDGPMSRYAWWRKWRGLPEPGPLSPVLEMLMREALAVAREDCALAFHKNKPLPPEGGTIRIRRPNQYAPSNVERRPEQNGKRHP